MEAKSPYLSVVVPAYNEEKRIGQTLIAVDKFLTDKGFSFETLVVSDGSHDQTASIVEGYAKMMSHVRLLANKENHGKGHVVRQGMVEAHGTLRLFTDADNATPIEELDKLLPYIKQETGGGEYDVVIGSIGLKESEVEKGESGVRALAGKMANLLIQIMVLPGIHDTQRGFKLFTANAAQEIFSRCRIDRWGFDIEALAIARKMGYRIKEVPIRWIHQEGSKVKASAYINTLLDLLRIRIRLWTGVYRIPKR